MFKAKIGLELDEIPRDGSFCTYAILQPDVLIVPDPLSDERFMTVLGEANRDSILRRDTVNYR